MDVIHAIIHWFISFTGADNTSGLAYGFWSGFGSDLGEITLIGSMITLYRHHKCVRCWRVGKHKVETTGYITCHKHTTPLTHEELKAHFKKRHPKQHAVLKSR